MSILFTSDTDDLPMLPRGEADAGDVEVRPASLPVDGNLVRWVFAATVVFWMAVYALGKSLF